MAALGDLLFRAASVWQRLAGNTTATKKFLRQTGTGAVSAAPAWDTIVAGDLPNTTVTPGSYTSTNLTVDAQGRLTAASNGSGSGTVTHTGSLTANELVVGNGTADIKAVAATDGQIPIGKTSDGSVTLATITPGANITVTNAAGAITIAASAGVSGALVQVKNTETGAVATGTTTIPFDNTIPQNTEGDEYMTLAITPTNSANKLKIDVVFFGTAAVQAEIAVALFQDSTANALAVVSQTNVTNTARLVIAFTHYMTAGTTSATTFKVRAGWGVNSTTLTFNGVSGGRLYGGVAASSITISEIVP